MGILKRPVRRSAHLSVYESFGEAKAASSGYEDRRIVEVVARKTHAYRDALARSRRITSVETAYMLLAVAAAAKSRPVSVLEFGGACGAGFVEAQVFLPGRVDRWEVVETPLMAAAGTEGFADDGLSFVAALGDIHLSDIDLVVAAGSLQYTADPVRVLRSLLDLGPSHLFVSRLPLAASQPVFISQTTRLEDHGPGIGGPSLEQVSTPATFAAHSEFIGALAPHYVIEMWFPTASPYRLSGQDVREHAFLARR